MSTRPTEPGTEASLWQRSADTARKVYHRPRIVWRGSIEACAGVCTPAPPGKGDPTCTIVKS